MSTNFTFESHPPTRILLISWRYLGDTLLLTPLLSSLKNAYPHAAIDVLIPSNNAAVLENNPDIHRVITIASKPKLGALLRLLLSLFRRYDLAINTQTSDRPTLCAIVAGRQRVSVVPPRSEAGGWKRWFFDATLEFSLERRHALLGNLRFCELLGIAPCYRVTPPRSAVGLPMPNARDWLSNDSTAPFSKGEGVNPKYAVLHVMPQWRYKQWHNEGWVELGRYLRGLGYRLVLTGSPLPEERAAIDALLAQLPDDSLNLAGQLSLGQLTGVIERAGLFIGPDTGITHLAAATGTLTVAIFGPTDPQKWGPWPKDYAQGVSPFVPKGSQRVGNVLLIQGVDPRGCMPCQRDGCEHRRFSHSDCLDGLTARSVIDAIDKILN